MTTNAATTFLKYANLQMAAEAVGFPEGYRGLIPKATLTDGNNRSSKFTNTQADQLIADGWTVVAHKANTTTGFSGTLFKYTGQTDAARGLINGELVLSFRSTEFIDDAARRFTAPTLGPGEPRFHGLGDHQDLLASSL